MVAEHVVQTTAIYDKYSYYEYFQSEDPCFQTFINSAQTSKTGIVVASTESVPVHRLNLDKWLPTC